MQRIQSLDIIVPCFNPRNGWEKLLSESIARIKQELPKNALQTVIVVNDGSTKGISEKGIEALFANLPEIKLIEYDKNKGKGYAVRKGVRSSEADIQIYSDIDIPYTDSAIVEFYNLLNEDKADIVIASRGDSYYNSLSFFRRVLSKSLRWLNGFLFGLKIKDTQGGLKGFNQVGRNVFLKTRVNRYLFDLEFIKKASKTDLVLAARDVKLKPDIVLPSPSPVLLMKEVFSFLKLLTDRD